MPQGVATHRLGKAHLFCGLFDGPLQDRFVLDCQRCRDYQLPTMRDKGSEKDTGLLLPAGSRGHREAGLARTDLSGETSEAAGEPHPSLASGATHLGAGEEGHDWESVVLETDPTFWKLVQARREETTLSLEELTSRLKKKR